MNITRIAPTCKTTAAPPFGKESAGVPEEVAATADARIRLPMRAEVRSLNLAMSAALALGEGLRQTGRFAG